MLESTVIVLGTLLAGWFQGSGSADLACLDVLSKLKLPHEMSAKLSIVYERHAVQNDSILSSAAHYSEARAARSGVAVGSDGARVEYSSPEAVCVVNSSLKPIKRGRLERVYVKGTELSVHTYGHWVNEQPKYKGRSNWRIYLDSGELVRWDDVFVGKERYIRSHIEPSSQSISGALRTANTVFVRTKKVIELCVEYGAVQLTDSGFVAFLDVSEPEVLGLFEGIKVDNGFKDTPGYVELSYSSVGSVSSLRCGWRDSLDSLVVRDSIRWNGRYEFPDTISKKTYMVGDGSELSTVSIDLKDYDTSVDVSKLSWSPVAGSSVVDFRFGVEIEYSVEVNGALPLDSDLIASCQFIDPQSTHNAVDSSGAVIGDEAVGESNPGSVGTDEHLHSRSPNRKGIWIGGVVLVSGCLLVLGRRRK